MYKIRYCIYGIYTVYYIRDYIHKNGSVHCSKSIFTYVLRSLERSLGANATRLQGGLHPSRRAHLTGRGPRRREEVFEELPHPVLPSNQLKPSPL